MTTLFPIASPGPTATEISLGTFGKPVVTNVNSMILALTQSFTTWSTYEPTWDSTGTDPDIGNGTLVGRFMRLGTWGQCVIDLVFGSTTSIGTGNYRFTLPPSWAPENGTTVTSCLGSGYLIDSSPGIRYQCAPLLANFQNSVFLTTNGLSLTVAHNNPFTFAQNDHIGFTVTVELD